MLKIQKMTAGSSKQLWGLVLMGGGARGLAHIGVLKALTSNGLKPDVIAGTSMGAVVGGFHAAGITLNEMENLMTELGYTSLIEKPLLGRRPRTMTGK